MARLIYTAITSLDGYIADANGNFNWAAPEEELLVRRMKAQSDLSVGGPDLAGQAIKAGLVDEIHLFLNPVVVGGGSAAWS